MLGVVSGIAFSGLPSFPGGIGGSFLLAYGAFVGVKLVGYTAFAAFARVWLGPSRWSVPTVGLVRTLVGIVVGLGVWAIGAALVVAAQSVASEAAAAQDPSGDASSGLFGPWPLVVLLVFVRVFEWRIVLRWAHKEAKPTRIHVLTAVGIAWSFALDAIGIAAAFAVPGGISVC